MRRENSVYMTKMVVCSFRYEVSFLIYEATWVKMAIGVNFCSAAKWKYASCISVALKLVGEPEIVEHKIFVIEAEAREREPCESYME